MLLLALELARSSLARIPCVAGRARCRRGLVEEHGLSVDGLLIGMTGGAGNILVRAFEREGCLLVVKERRLPLVAVVARRAILAVRAELVEMRVFVAFAALGGGLRKRNMHHGSLQVWRSVAIDACHRAMRSGQRKLCTVMVEACEVRPLFRRVTGLATLRLSGSTEQSHTPGKLSLMNILMARGATQLREMKLCNGGARHWLVTLVTRYSHMATCQWKAALLMLRQSHRRCLERVAGVTLLTPIAPGVAGELSLVRILMTIDAYAELDLVKRLRASRNMAGGTLHRGVRRYQREARLRVIGLREDRWRPALHRVTTLAAPSIGPLRKLPGVRIGFVAVRAESVRNRRLEVARLVTGQARDLEVLTRQSKVRLRMIER